MKRVVAGIITLVAVGAIAWWQSGKVAPTDQLSTPAQCVQTMFEAARQGDVERYLDCFSGTERDRLAREFSGPNAASGSDALRRSVADLKGWALLDPPAQPGSSCVLTIEWVYAARVDKQRLELRRLADAWRIIRVEEVRPGQPAIPYGTPVSG